MQIHNFFSDILLSTQILLDHHIFPADFIKSYEFNYGNRSVKLMKNDYKTNFSLPAAIVTLNDELYTFGERTEVVHRKGPENINQIPVLEDIKSKQIISIQEEHTQVSINISINCESQFQAKEVAFVIKRFLPLQKYISFLKFTSFLEIHPKLLLDLGMRFDNYNIFNLFTKLNKNTGNLDYCYSIKYEPLIKLESLNVNIADTTQRTFNVGIDILYQIQMPMFVHHLKLHDQNFKAIKLDFQRFGNEPITRNTTTNILINENLVAGDKYSDVKMNLIVSDPKDYIYTETNDFNLFLLQEYISNAKIKISELCNLNNIDNINIKNLITDNIIELDNLNLYLQNTKFKNTIFYNKIKNNEIQINIQELLDLILYPNKDITNQELINNFSRYEVESLLKNFIECFYTDKINLINDIQYKYLLSCNIENYEEQINLNKFSINELITSLLNDDKNIHNQSLYSYVHNLNLKTLTYFLQNKFAITDLISCYNKYLTSGVLGIVNDNVYLNELIEDGLVNILQIECFLNKLGVITINHTTSFNRILGIHLTLDNLVFNKNFIYNLYDINHNTYYDYKPVYVDYITNTVYFQFTYNTFINNFNANVTSPIIIQIIEKKDAILNTCTNEFSLV